MAVLTAARRRAWAALAAALVGSLAGCYDPQLEDCTLTCVAGDACADGQVCGADGFCARPSVAGTCAAPAAVLRIAIARQGQVVVDVPAFVCASTSGGGASCTTPIARAGWLELEAVATDQQFDRWTSRTCAGQPARCRVPLGAATIDVAARFE